jgi:hypothetical protein
MCGKKRERVAGGYEGETTRLSLTGEASRERESAGWHWGGFPWWTLWLIWPAIMVVKWIAPLIAASYTELMAITVPLLPVVLIMVGLALIVRRER